jgi:peptidyl-tRNA hydrolase, PTH1 family
MMTELNRWMIVGLGNPGRKYERTRHNVGFMVIDRIAEANRIPMAQKKFESLIGLGAIDDKKVVLVKPLSFMNLSGQPIMRLSTYFGVTYEHILVIHDDIDLMFGQIKIKAKGGHGGHNGIRSIMDAFGCGDFPRIRIGIGRPGAEVDVTDHVLGKFFPEEIESVQPLLKNASDAALLILSKGITQGMNQFNKKPFKLLNS